MFEVVIWLSYAIIIAIIIATKIAIDKNRRQLKRDMEELLNGRTMELSALKLCLCASEDDAKNLRASGRIPSDGPCIDCGREDVTFSVSGEMWEKITELSQNGGILCPRCFEKRAIIRGFKLSNWTVNIILESKEEW